MMRRGKERRRQITRDQIGSPTEFMHIDGHSFLDQKVVDLDQARYNVLVERLRKSAAAITSIVTRSHHCHVEHSPCLLVSHRCSRSRLAPSPPNVAHIDSSKISKPYGFVHVNHVTVENLSAEESPVPTITSDDNASLHGDSSVAEHSG